MNISVMGLGYVGTVTAACLARYGHHVTGVDINREKVALINAGKSPVVEPELGDIIQATVRSRHLRATDDFAQTIEQSETILVCVGTPSTPQGGITLEHLERVCTDIGTVLARADDYKVVVIRSTVLPDVFESRLIPLLAQASGKQPGVDFGVVANPEFIREGSAVADFESPPFTVIGATNSHAGDRVASLYAEVDAPIFHTSIEVACMVKYASNAFHALKVVFANEIGRLCNSMNADASAVMEIFTQDTHLNISPRYLRPGFAFGGSCLPKDVRALVHSARHHDVSVPVLESLLPSNDQQIALAVDMIERTGRRSVAMLGLSFKPDTDDLRESPLVRLTETLLGKGYAITIYDEAVNLSRLTGTNLAYIDRMIPHLAALMSDTPQIAIAEAEVIVAARHISPDLKARIRPAQIVIDLMAMRASSQAPAGVEIP